MLLRHNLPVFRGGEGGPRAWARQLGAQSASAAGGTDGHPLPPPPWALPEARLNLVIAHLRQAWGLGDGGSSGTPPLPLLPPPHPFLVHPAPVGAALALLGDLGHEPASPVELTLAGQAHLAAGLAAAAAAEVVAGGGAASGFSPAAVAAADATWEGPIGSRPGREHTRAAQAYLHALGASPGECDTLPGRHALAACLLSLGQHDDAVSLLESVAAYAPPGDAAQAVNTALALVSCGGSGGGRARYSPLFRALTRVQLLIASHTRVQAATGEYGRAAALLSKLPEFSANAPASSAGALRGSGPLPLPSPLMACDASLPAWFGRCLVHSGRAGAGWELYLRLRQAAATAAAAAAAAALEGDVDAPLPIAAPPDRDRDRVAQLTLLRVLASDGYKGTCRICAEGQNYAC